IRDGHVTGVQTCALPIFSKHRDALEFVTVLTAINAAQMDHMLSLIDQSDGPPAPAESGPSGEHVCSAREALVIAFIVLAPLALRSEERRVGKGCRGRSGR